MSYPRFGSDAHDDLVAEGDPDAVEEAIQHAAAQQAAEDAENKRYKDSDEEDD